MMKTVLVILSCLLLAAACKDKAASHGMQALQKAQQDTANYTHIQWIDSLVNFGTVTKGEKVNVTFHFRNTGNKPLIITNVVASCGCTAPDFTKTPVEPGKEGVVTGAFDSNHANPGAVRKTIMVTANTLNKQQFELVFNGTVLAAK